MKSAFSFPFILLAGTVSLVPGACWPTWQVWSPLRDLPWPEESTIWGAWFNAFRRWCRSYYTCWILHQQPQRDMDPSLRKLKGPDQSFSNRVCRDYEARKPVITIIFHVSSTPILNLFVTCASKFMIFSVLLSWPDSFYFIGMNADFTRWNTLKSAKADVSLSSQLQWSLSFAKYTHGTGWWMKISTSGPTHESS